MVRSPTCASTCDASSGESAPVAAPPSTGWRREPERVRAAARRHSRAQAHAAPIIRRIRPPGLLREAAARSLFWGAAPDRPPGKPPSPPWPKPIRRSRATSRAAAERRARRDRVALARRRPRRSRSGSRRPWRRCSSSRIGRAASPLFAWPLGLGVTVGWLLIFAMLRAEESRLARELRTARTGTPVLRALVARRRQELPFLARWSSSAWGRPRCSWPTETGTARSTRCERRRCSCAEGGSTGCARSSRPTSSERPGPRSASSAACSGSARPRRWATGRPTSTGSTCW